MKYQLIILALLALAANADIGIRCGTQEAHEAFLRGEGMARPSDGHLFINTPYSIVHYDTTGTHACTPAYAESTAVYAENVRAIQIVGKWIFRNPTTCSQSSPFVLMNLRFFSENDHTARNTRSQTCLPADIH